MKSSTLLETPVTKQEEGGGGREWLSKDKGKETATTNGFQNHLELRLGISPNNNNNNGSRGMKEMTTSVPNNDVGSNHKFLMTTTLDGLAVMNANKSWYPESSGFIHPWSLAARQQKAVFEQAHHKSNPSSSSTIPRVNPSLLTPIVGWPPVRTFRKNLVSQQATRPDMDGEKDPKKAKVSTNVDDANSIPELKPATMFVKVNMEGFAVGRKINLKAHDSYESLSSALQKMFINFLSPNFSCETKEEEKDDVTNVNYILLYEDHEGDRMLVGDVPWELFITSVKRLYIAHNQKPKPEHAKGEDKQDPSTTA